MDTQNPEIKPQTNFFADSQNTFALFKEISINARFVIDKIWANAKFFTTITSALLTLSVAAIASLLKDKPDLILHPILPILLAILPIILIIVSYIGIKNLEREYIRFIQWVIVTQKLYEMLGATQQFSFKKYKNDRYLLPEQFILDQYENSEEFIKNSLKKKNTLLSYFKWLHGFYMVIGFLLLILLLLLRGYCS